MDEISDIRTAQALDAEDELAAFRNEFVISEPDLIYLDGNSLGRLPVRTAELMRRGVEQEWGKRLIRGWMDGWIDLPQRLGAKIAGLIGARPDEVLVTEGTSINLFKLAAAALRALPDRRTIVSDEFNFPSDLYILQGLIDFWGESHGQGYRLKLARSPDDIHMSDEALPALLDGDTALVCLTHVAYKSAFMYDMAEVTRRAHAAGALVCWDLCHSVGAAPLDLDAAGVDLAVGCTYKYLNGGPGAPAFLYVRKELQERLNQPLWGWFASDSPFDFDLYFKPAPGITRFRVGSIPVLSMLAVEPGVDLILEAGIERLRTKSVRQSEYLIALAERWLFPLDFCLGSPRDVEKRGSHVSLRHAEGYRITRALIESPPPAPRVIPDFRTPDNIRLGIAPIYTTYSEIYLALDRMRSIVEEGIYRQYPEERLAVT